MIRHRTIFRGGLLTALALVSCYQMVSAQDFTNPFNGLYYGFPTGTIDSDRSPYAARMADLDGDGDLDALIAQGNFSSGFAVLLNLGNGYFSPPAHYYSGTLGSYDLVVADFTGDGKLDVVVSNGGQWYDGTTISLFPGKGDGTFGTKSNYTVGNDPIGLAAADFNGDGRVDLAVANNGGFGSDSTLSILYANSAGRFDKGITIPGGNAPYKLATGFINGDTIPDIVVANEKQYVTVLLGTGTGFRDSSYQVQPTYSSGDAFFNVTVADIDNDSDQDIVYSSHGTNQFALLRNNGDGTMAPVEKIAPDFMYGGSASVQLADLNGDAHLDLIAATASGRTSDGYRVFMNKGDGTFAPPTLRSAGEYTFIVLAADVDLDGDIDLLTVDQYSMELTVHLNDGAGNFPEPTRYTEGLDRLFTLMEAGDVDNDGDLDIAFSADGRTAVNVPVSVSLNNGDGSFGQAIIYSDPGLGGVGVKLRDLNNDGYLDLLYASGINTTPYDFFTALNKGDGTFAPPRRWSMNSCGWNDIDATDLDRDGDLDVVISEWLGCPTVPLSGKRLYVCYNNGDATFSAPEFMIVGPSPAALAMGDFNEDGYVDVAHSHATTVEISLNDRTGDLLPSAPFQLDQSPYDLIAVDLNGDGHLDIASCNYGSNPGDYSVAIRPGNGDGTFGPIQLLPAAYSPDLANVAGLATGDVDGDGDLDLILASGSSNDMVIYANDGKGSFSYGMRLGVDHGVRSPWFADFDRDGKGDVAALISLPPSGGTSALAIVTGKSTGSLTGGTGLYESKFAPASVSNSDMAVDLKMEVSPNPFSSRSELRFRAPVAGKCSVTLYNALGKLVATPFTGSVAAGERDITITRGTLPAGVYRLQLTAGGISRSIPVVLE